MGGSMKRGDIVKYSRPVNQEKAAFRFILLNEPEKGRADIQLICDDRIKPTETVEAGEIELARRIPPQLSGTGSIRSQEG